MGVKSTTTDECNGIMPEIYAVSAEYQQTLARLTARGTTENQISQADYLGALRACLGRCESIHVVGGGTDAELRKSLTDLATLALRWARKVRPS